MISIQSTDSEYSILEKLTDYESISKIVLSHASTGAIRARKNQLVFSLCVHVHSLHCHIQIHGEKGTFQRNLISTPQIWGVTEKRLSWHIRAVRVLWSKFVSESVFGVMQIRLASISRRFLVDYLFCIFSKWHRLIFSVSSGRCFTKKVVISLFFNRDVIGDFQYNCRVDGRKKSPCGVLESMVWGQRRC